MTRDDAVEAVPARRRRERHAPSARPPIREPSGGGKRHLVGVDEHERVGFDARATFLSSRSIVSSSWSPRRIRGDARFGLIGVERRLQRRVFGERRGLHPHFALTPRLERREHPLAGLEVAGHGTPHLVAHAERDDDEDDDEQQGDGQERDSERLDQEPRRTAAPAVMAVPRPAATGRSRRLLPASTRTGARPFADALVPADDRVVAGRHVRQRRTIPSGAGIVKYG